MTIHKIIDVVTGEETLLDYTEKELNEQKAAQAAIDARLAEDATKAEAKAALLERLGITEDEAKLLLA